MPPVFLEVPLNSGNILQVFRFKSSNRLLKMHECATF